MGGAHSIVDLSLFNDIASNISQAIVYGWGSFHC